MSRGNGDDTRRLSRSRSPIRDRRRPLRGGSNRMVFLSNLPYEMRWMELKTLIREKAGEVTFIEILEERSGRSKGTAIVEFTTEEGAKNCIENLFRCEVSGRTIMAKEIRDPDAFFRKVKEETGLDFMDRAHGGGSRSSVRGVGGGYLRRDLDRADAVDEGELFGLSPAFLRQLSITPPLCERVFVANLAYSVTSGQVWEIFSMAGKVTFVDLQVDKEGKNRGNAVVEYSHPLEAVQAISMLNGQKLYDRGVIVKMDKYEKKMPLAKGELPRGLAAVGMGLGADGAPLVDIAQVVSSFRADFASSPVGASSASMMQSSFPSPFVKSESFSRGDSFIRPSFDSFKTPDPLSSSSAPSYGPSSYSVGGSRGDYGRHADSFVSPSRDQLPPFGGRDPAPPTPVAASPSFPSRDAPPSFSARDAPPSFSTRDAPPSFTSRDVPPSFGGGRGALSDSFNGNSMFPPVKKEEFGSYGVYSEGRAHSAGYSDSRPKTAAYSSRLILIKNLPHDYTWQIVRDRAMGFGEVEACELLTPGVARVRFSQMSEAERARGALAGTSVEGRPISVDFVI